MDTAPARTIRFFRVRRWFGRHLLAMVATMIVVGTFAWKDQYRLSEGFTDVGNLDEWGDYGWPWTCVDREDVFYPYTTGPVHTREFSIGSWTSLVLDASVAIAVIVATWAVFSGTQQRCGHWWQISLKSLLALLLLASVLSAITASDWPADDPSPVSGGSQPDS